MTAAASDSGVSGPRAVTLDLVNGQKVGEYRIEGKLGEGAMGSVYAAIHPVIKKRAAIKVISPALCASPDAVERFVQEARAVNEIGHPNIVDVFSLGTLADGRCYFAMEWLQGETLGARLRRGPMPLAEAFDILDDIAGALEAAHEAGVIHRDLKPDNVFLVPVKGRRAMVKLLDFGLAKLAGGDDQRVERTRTGMLMGTPLYISPEQARGKNVDHRTDLYALGAVAFEMIAGQPPFWGDSAMDIVAMHMTAPPPSLRSMRPDMSEELDTLLVRALDKIPAQRTTLTEFRDVVGRHRDAAITGSAPPRPLTAPVLAMGETVSASAQISASQLASQRAAAAQSSPAMPSAPTAAMSSVTPTPARSRRGVAIAAVAVVIAGGVALAIPWWRGQGDAPAAAAAPERAQPAAPAPAQPPPAPAAAATAPAEPTQAAPVAASAQPTPTTGTVGIRVDVAGAEVRIGDRTVALDADGRGEVELPAGRHALAVSAPGHQPFEDTVEVTPGERVVIPVRLTRAQSDKRSSGKRRGSSPAKTPAKKAGSDDDIFDSRN